MTQVDIQYDKEKKQYIATIGDVIMRTKTESTMYMKISRFLRGQNK